jgi:OmcA/MtrC family decaheme c-type cytochrome
MFFKPILRAASRPAGRCVLALLVLLTSAILISAPKSPFNEHDKAFYADANTVNFVRPGLAFDITSASIATDGTITCQVKVADPRGLGLDRLGVTTPGTVSMSFIVAYIPKGKTQYVSYLTRTQTSPITNKSALQATGQNNGTFTQVGDGVYNYVFSVKAPASMDRTATHTIAVYGSRNLSEFDLPTNYDDDTFDFVPDGTKVTVTRDVIKTATCNKCHDQMGFHGGSRRTMEVCVLCHTPQTVDPDTGNSVDMIEMTHKIHSGVALPSVEAGTPYKIIGNSQSVHDYSHIAFPAGTRNCVVCHEQDKGAAQKEAWLSPTRQACGSCHDNVNFATGKNHLDLPQVSDNQCATCHTPQGELEFDASIRGAHTVGEYSKTLPGTVFEILGVTDAGPGKKPTVSFSVKDKRGNPVDTSKMARLSLVLSGPTADYRTMVTEDVRTASGTADGRRTWTFNTALPADAKGSFSVGIEGYSNVMLLPGTERQLAVRDAGTNKVRTFAVDGAPMAPRRAIVSLDKCNACHFNLSLHGGNRNTIDQCVLCHNPATTDAAVRPAAAGAPESIDMRLMIHRIHTGAEMERDYTIYGRGSTEHNYNKVGYPGDRRNCAGCHVNGSEQLPLDATSIEVTDPRGPLNPIGPTAAACTSCHSSVYAASHALANTTKIGESCAACHGPNAEHSINRAHAR